jgi:probable rRNA maturation factor
MSEAAARKLNREYRGKDYATDVLSFSGDGLSYLGELILCVEVVKRQAKNHALSFRDESAYLVLHGLLHLLGFEHEQGGTAAKKMYALQDNLFDDIDKIK